MMIAALLAALGLAALSTGGLIYFARAALLRADGKGASDTKAAQLGGEVAVAADKVEQANENVRDAATALDAERARSETLEREANDAHASGGGSVRELLDTIADVDGLDRP